MNFIDIPKVELHRHLDCCLRPETVFELANELELNLPLDDFEKFKQATLIKEPMLDLETVLKKFLVVQQVLATPIIIERMAFEAVEDAFNDNIKTVEFRYSPAFIREGHEDLSYSDIHQAVMRGIRKATKQFDIKVGLIAILRRTDSLAFSRELCDFIFANKEDFVALDLADAEINFDCKNFAPLFAEAKQEGLNITVHAGEPNYPGAHQSVKDAVEILGAQRIGRMECKFTIL